jgi:hypothetical protein
VRRFHKPVLLPDCSLSLSLADVEVEKDTAGAPGGCCEGVGRETRPLVPSLRGPLVSGPTESVSVSVSVRSACCYGTTQGRTGKSGLHTPAGDWVWCRLLFAKLKSTENLSVKCMVVTRCACCWCLLAALKGSLLSSSWAPSGCLVLLDEATGLGEASGAWPHDSPRDSLRRLRRRRVALALPHIHRTSGHRGEHTGKEGMKVHQEARPAKQANP